MTIIKFVFTLLALLFLTTLKAQKHEKWMELHGSFENTRFTNHESGEEFQERVGHSDGLNFQFFISEKSFFVSGLSLTSVLYKTPVKNQNTKVEHSYAVHSSTFMFMPLMLGLEFKMGERFNFAPRGGLQIGAPLREKTKFFYNDGSKQFESDYSLLLHHTIVNSNIEFAFEFLATERFRISLMPFLTKRLSNVSSSIIFRSKSNLTYGIRGNLKLRL